MASLLILKGENPGQRYQIQTDTVIIGRNPTCHIIIGGNAVSREHARILRVNGKFYIEDGDGERASRNGTFVNNQPIAGRTLLKDNDRIKICDFLCTFESGARAPLPAEFRRDEPEEEEDTGQNSTFEATLGRISSQQLLESQPAEKLKALLEISNSLSRSLEFESLLPQVADNLLQLFRQADRCFLIQRDEASGRQIPKLIKTRRPGAESTASWSKSIVKQCLETPNALLSEDASTDTRFGLSQSIADFRIRSVMCAPLCNTEGKPFAVIQIDTQDRSKKFNPEDLKFLVAVANQIAAALQNARLHEDLLARERFLRDLELARQVQRGFLPRRPPDHAGYEFFTHYEAAQQVGGDYYDFLPLPNQRIGVMLGDVAGKGVPAALLMAKLSAECRYCMLTETNLADAVTMLNTLLTKAGLLDRFVTLAACVLDPVAHIVTVTNAGHLTPLVYRQATGTLEEAVPPEVSGVPLGVMEDFQYESAQVELKVGDSLVLFTDGVTDALNTQNVPFQVKGIQAAVTTVSALDPEFLAPGPLGQRIVKAVKQHSLGCAQHDDIALVCFGRLAGSEAASVTAAHSPIFPRPSQR